MTHAHAADDAGVTGNAVEPLILVEDEVIADDVIILRPVGELDMLTTPTLRVRLLAELGRCRHVIVDCSEIRFLSSGGVQLLVEAHERALEAGAMLHVAAAAHRVVARPLEITGVDTVLDVTAEPADAVASRVIGRKHLDSG